MTQVVIHGPVCAGIEPVREAFADEFDASGNLIPARPQPKNDGFGAAVVAGAVAVCF